MNIDIIDIDTIDAATVRIDGLTFNKADCAVSAFQSQHAQIAVDGETFIVSHGSSVDGRRPTGQAALIFAIESLLSGGGGSSTFLQTGSGAVSRSLTNKLRESFSVKDFGATGDGSTDDGAAIQAALDAAADAGGGWVLLPTGTYLYNDRDLEIPPGVSFGNPMGNPMQPYTSDVPTFGAILKPTGNQNGSALKVLTDNPRGFTLAGFCIDMSGMDDGTVDAKYDPTTQTKGIYIVGAMNFEFSGIGIFNIPTNGTGLHIRGDLDPSYCAEIRRLYIAGKKAVGDDLSARGVVVSKGTWPVTSLTFSSCMNYRGTYLQSLANGQFINYSAEHSPKHGIEMEDCGSLTFIGGYYEFSGTETADFSYEFTGDSSMGAIKLDNVNMSGNGVDHATLPNLTMFGCGEYGEAGEERLNRIASSLTIDREGQVSHLRNTNAKLYVANFNSTVPPSTADHTIVFGTRTAGWGVLAEYAPAQAWFMFKKDAITGTNGTYEIGVHFRMTSAVAIPSSVTVTFTLGGSLQNGEEAQTLKVRGNGTTELFLNGTLTVRLVSAFNLYFQPTLFHAHSNDIVIDQADNDATKSYMTVRKVL